jgi:hypothetical protein
MKSKLFLILGLHRSGTSATAGTLFQLGINMGEKMLGAIHGNPKGHYENYDYLMLNEEILRRVGGSWDNPPSREKINPQIFPREIIESFVSYAMKPVWGLKDPRTLLTLGLWMPYLEEVSNITFIFVHRPFQSSVLSLASRDGMTPENATAILQPYQNNLEYYRETFIKAKQDILDINFEDLINQPEIIVQEINQRMGKRPDENLDKVKEFLDLKLKHF